MRVMRDGAVMLLMVVAACGGGGDGPTAGGGPGPGGGGGGGGGGSTCTSTSANVTVNDSFFTPDCTTVPVGTTVTWTWNGGLDHNVTFSNTSLGTSGNRSNGATFSKQFPAAGTFAYSCTLHAGMNGSVVVQ